MSAHMFNAYPDWTAWCRPDCPADPPHMTDTDREVERFLAADRRQKESTEAMVEAGRVKMEAVVALRDAGLTYAEIGSRVGLSVPGVQRIADKANR